MKITALMVIEKSHIIGYRLDNEKCIYLHTLKEHFKNSTLEIENATLNKFNQIEITNEISLPTETVNNSNKSTNNTTPSYLNKAIFIYYYQGKPLKINQNFYDFFEENGDNFKPYIYIDNKPITEMRFLFKNISQAYINVSNIDTQFIKDMTGMFNYSATYDLDLSTFDTSKVTTMRLMFAQCNIKKLDISNFNMSRIIDISRMFSNSTIQELILPKIDVLTLLRADEIFKHAQIEILNVSNIDLSTRDSVKKLIRILHQNQTNISTLIYKDAHSDIESLLKSDWAIF